MWVTEFSICQFYLRCFDAIWRMSWKTRDFCWNLDQCYFLSCSMSVICEGFWGLKGWKGGQTQRVWGCPQFWIFTSSRSSILSPKLSASVEPNKIRKHCNSGTEMLKSFCHRFFSRMLRKPQHIRFEDFLDQISWWVPASANFDRYFARTLCIYA